MMIGVIERGHHSRRLELLLRRYPVVAMVGARQVGKTTLARTLANHWTEQVHLFDLESPIDLARLDDAVLALEPLRGLVVLDEIQRRPEIFTVLRVLADRHGNPARFLVLGSASPDLLRQTSESLAGRVAYHELPGFSWDEVPEECLNALWLRGGFPRSFTAEDDEASFEWRGSFVRTFLERDVPQLGINIRGPTLHRFWSMLAHDHGQIWNGSELGRAFGVSHHAVRRYLDILESTLMVRSLKPWIANIKKRQVKAPRIYIRDSGIVHWFLGLPNREVLERHPKVGASWEGHVLENLIRQLRLEDRQCHYWRTHTGAEIDLVVEQDGVLRGFEIKRSSAPRLTPSMRIAMADLGLSRIDVIHAGTESYPLAKNVQAVSLDDVAGRRPVNRTS